MLTSPSSPVDALPRPIAVPDEALRFILLQRTQYHAKGLLFRALGRLTRRSPVAVEARWRGKEVRRAFNRDLAREYDELRPHLPAHATAILDIGCGVGGIDVLLHRHYGRPRLHLADRTQTSRKVYYGFEEKGAFYNSFDATRRLLVGNGIPERDLFLHEVGEECRLDVHEPLDLVVSLISWGFHYPVAVYADQVHALLRPGGRAILDVRKGTDGLEQLKSRFARVERVSETPKKERVSCER
jgi:SAM-dependent methyltransferase